MTTSAAFFDLDRTLLLGASGPTLSNALRHHGLLPDDPIPGEGIAFKIFDVFGENLPSILLTRQGARGAKGWPVDKVNDAAIDLAPTLASLIEPFAKITIDEHRAAGRKVVLATTTPYQLVKPFADIVGFDDVLATRYRAGDDERFDGTIDGEFVWSQGKARSVKVWARANMVDLDQSYAYSDSFFDIPMLAGVGNPVAVNPDPRLFAYAKARGWTVSWFNAPPGVPKPVGLEPQRAMAMLAREELFPWINMQITGMENLPESGAAILASNHRSYLDPLVVSFLSNQRGRPARFLAKKEVTDAPIVGALATALGAIRVDRGSGSETPMLEAARALKGGELIAVFPQGTIPRGQQFFDPVLQGRYGAVRLALASGTPLVPVGVWGTEKAWPRSSRVPYVLNLADPPKVSIAVGEPFFPDDDEDVDAATVDLMARIAELLPDDARHEHEPSASELALTFPPGHAASEAD